MLEIKDLTVHYGVIQALSSVNCEIQKGSVVCILGANGAGKSSFLGALVGMVPKVSGIAKFEGESILGLSTDNIIRRGIVLVPEGRHLFADLTVNENLAMGAYLRKDKVAVQKDMETVRKLFPRLAERSKQMAGTLSGGEQQMLAIGRGIMSRPRVMLLDEPSLGLAPVLVVEIMRLIKEINYSGVTILLVEQNARQALRISRYAYVIERGSVVMSGEAARLSKEQLVVSAYLGGSKKTT